MPPFMLFTNEMCCDMVATGNEATRVRISLYSQTLLIRASLIRMLYNPNTLPGNLALLSFTLYNDSVIRMFQNPNTL